MKALDKIIMGDTEINLRIDGYGIQIPEQIATEETGEDDWLTDTTYRVADTDDNKVLGAVLKKCIETIADLCDRISTLENAVNNLYD